MKYKLICCEVLIREICLAIANSSNTIDPEFIPKGAHDKSDHLRHMIQQKIDNTEETGGYDAIILGYGLCGNSTAGIRARSIPIIIPRAHDCCTLFLGSKERLMDCFKDNLSKEWSSTGYMERGDSHIREYGTENELGLRTSYQEYVDKYGEENAKYIWESLHPAQIDKELIFIDIPETAHLGYCNKLKKMAESEGKTVNVIQGDTRLIRGLIQGGWDENEYLVVHPGEITCSAYDYDTILQISDK